jgi:hypothetical protein
MTLREVLTERSWRHLVEFVDFTLGPMLRDATDSTEQERVVELHLIAFREFESLLKLAVDGRDETTLSKVDEVWSEVVEDPWWLWDEQPAYEENPVQTPIARDRAVGRMGIAMWAAHEAARENDVSIHERLLRMLRQIGRHFDTLDHLLLGSDWAQEQEDRRQWDNWFLAQLPERQAHFIPTRQQLLFVTLLLALDRISHGAVVRPRPWMRERWQEIDESLRRIEAEPERWAAVLSPEATVAAEPAPSATPHRPSLQTRVDLLRGVLASGRDAAEEAERAQIREARPDPKKQTELREQILQGFAEQRLLHPMLERVAAITKLASVPEGYERQVLRTWLPKALFVPEGRMVGIEFVAGDLVRASVRAEIGQLLAALPDTSEPVAGDLGSDVRDRLGALRDANREPSLVLMPISWRARGALRLEPIGQELAEQLGQTVANALEGTLDGVPVLDTPLLEDRLWAIDLRRAIRWEEWPSDEDSGIAFEVRFFDRAAAEQLLAQHPEVREEGRTDEDAVQDIRSKVLLQLALCFRAQPRATDAAFALLLPEELRL